MKISNKHFMEIIINDDEAKVIYDELTQILDMINELDNETTHYFHDELEMIYDELETFIK